MKKQISLCIIAIFLIFFASASGEGLYKIFLKSESFTSDEGIEEVLS